jgi:hypothetical protein
MMGQFLHPLTTLINNHSDGCQDLMRIYAGLISWRILLYMSSGTFLYRVDKPSIDITH